MLGPASLSLCCHFCQPMSLSQNFAGTWTWVSGRQPNQWQPRLLPSLNRNSGGSQEGVHQEWTLTPGLPAPHWSFQTSPWPQVQIAQQDTPTRCLDNVATVSTSLGTDLQTGHRSLWRYLLIVLKWSLAQGTFPRAKEWLPDTAEGHSPSCLPLVLHLWSINKLRLHLWLNRYSLLNLTLSFKRRINITSRSVSWPWWGWGVWHHFWLDTRLWSAPAPFTPHCLFRIFHP